MTVVATSVIAMLLAVAWPFPAAWNADPQRLPEDQRPAAYQRSLDSRWQQVVDQYPDARRPSVRFVSEITEKNWNETMGACLRAAGFDVTGNGASVGYSASLASETDPQQAAIDRFACDAAYPYDGTMESLLSIDERGSLYDFYTRSLAPCLAMKGMAVPPAPDRRDFALQNGTAGDWLPYDWSWFGDGFSAETWNALDRDCPSRPSWQERRDG